jgi:hypothetical protein
LTISAHLLPLLWLEQLIVLLLLWLSQLCCSCSDCDSSQKVFLLWLSSLTFLLLFWLS